MSLSDILLRHRESFKPVVPFDGECIIAQPDLSPANKDLTAELLNDTDAFSAYMQGLRIKANATYLVGGYAEHREIYRRSELFDQNLQELSAEEPRNIHLGVDIWAPAGTPVFCPYDGKVHSFAFNDHFGDYGATIILEHKIDDITFYTLYGHLSKADLARLRVDDQILPGTEFAHFGTPAENGHWPPHLHFQIIQDLQGMQGDYPGVCKTSEKAFYLSNCPDPTIFFPFSKN